MWRRHLIRPEQAISATLSENGWRSRYGEAVHRAVAFLPA